jgi:hypothetical protein
MRSHDRFDNPLVALAALEHSGPVAENLLAMPGRDHIGLDPDGENLIWSYSGVPLRWRKPSASLLPSFIKLANGSPKRILAYAQQWGVLGICDHGLPSSHNPLMEPQSTATGADWPMGCSGIGANVDGQWQIREPLSAWRRLAGEALVMVAAMARMRDDDATSQLARHGSAMTALELRGRLNEWLRMGAVRPACQLHPDWYNVAGESKLLATVGGNGLFGALALRLLLAATGAYGLALCAGCGDWYTPASTPRPGERNWCRRGDCQKAKRAAASRDYYARENAKRATPTTPVSTPEPADDDDTPRT